MRVQLLLSVMLSMQCLLHGMLKIDEDKNKNLMFDLIVTHGLSHDDYDTHRNCAMVRKSSHKIIDDSYRPKKKPIENFMKWKTHDITGHKSWNKDFSKCAWITITSADSDKKNLQLTLVGLVNNDVDHIMSGSRLWQGFCFSIFEENVCPFFDKDGRAFFYGFGDIENRTSWVEDSVSTIIQDILEYSIDLNNTGQLCRCFCLTAVELAPRYTKHYRYFTEILNFPLLLKALLLQSSQRCDQENTKQCMTDAINFPEDYKTFKQHGSVTSALHVCYHYQSYDSLPEVLKNAFDRRYEEQQKEEKENVCIKY